MIKRFYLMDNLNDNDYFTIKIILKRRKFLFRLEDRAKLHHMSKFTFI